MVQVWRGALFLADFLLQHAKDRGFAGCCGLELGCGTGFSGLVLARTARTVFLTG